MAVTERLTANEFVIRVMERHRAIVTAVGAATLRKTLESSGSEAVAGLVYKSESDRYCRRVSTRTLNLIRVIERTERALRLLTMRRGALAGGNSPTVKASLMDEYHLYVFTTSLVSILDCCLLLVNETLTLGLREDLCNFKNIKGVPAITGTKTAQALRDLKRTLDEHIKRRHRYVHRGHEANINEFVDLDFGAGLWNDVVTDLFFHELERERGYEPDDPRWREFIGVVWTLWNSERDAVKARFSQAFADVERATDRVLGTLAEPFLRFAGPAGAGVPELG